MAKPVYSMSSVGGCPRAVVALRLGYDQVAAPEFMQLAAREGVRHEDWVAKDLEEHGWYASGPAYCEECRRDGLHVELEFAAYKLVGHIDRTVTHELVAEYPFPKLPQCLAEIKSLGRFRAEKLVKALAHGSFKEDFFGYAMQVSCYHHATGLPILYAVKNRDTGRLETFEIDVPISLEEIDSYVLDLELAARKEQLPACIHKRGDFERTICPVKYMCAGEDEVGEASPNMPSDEELFEAQHLWSEGREAENKAKVCLEKARMVFLQAVKASGQKTYRVGDFKLTYVAAGKTTSYPKARLEAIVPEELLVRVREEKPREEYVRVEEQ